MSKPKTLQVDTFWTPPIKTNTGLSDPDKQWWQPLVTTLIHGGSSAVLIDPPITKGQSEKVVEWVDSIFALYPGKTLTYIFITHAHGDHFFGAPLIQARWPDAKIIATATVVEGVKAMYSPEIYMVWTNWFPNGQLPEEKPLPTALPASNEFSVEHQVFKAYDHTSDCAKSSFLHVPSIALVVAGDIVYGDCHQHLGEANTAAKRQGWLDALAHIDQLEPDVVIPGHRRSSQVDGRYLVAATRKYMLDFIEWGSDIAADENIKPGDKSQALFRKVKQEYPQRWCDWLLLGGATAFFK